jgi:hypothetical protein
MGPRTHGPWLGSTEVDGARAFYGPDHYFSVERTRFEAAQDAAGLGGGKGLVEGAGGMDRQIVLHDTDAGGLGVMDIDEFAHAVSIIHGGAPFGDFDLAPGPMRIEGDEEIDGAVAAVLVIVRSRFPGSGGIGWRTSPMSWTGVSSKQTSGRSGSGASA